MTHRLILCAIALASAATAQHRGPDAPRAAFAADLVQAGFSLRWDFETGTVARVAWPEGPAVAGSAAAAARVAFGETLRPFLDPTLVVADDAQFAPLAGPSLVPDGTRDLGNGRVRVDYRQRAGALNVLQAGVSVEVAFDGEGWRPVVARLRYFPGIPAEAERPLPAGVAEQLLERYPGYETADFSVETLVTRGVLPTADGFRPVFVVTAFEPPVTSWQIHVDANGEELSRHPVSCTATADGQAYAKNPGETPRALSRLQRLYVHQGANRVTTDNQGNHNLTGMVSLDDGLAGPLTRVFVSRDDELQYTGPADIRLNPGENEAAQDELAGFFNLTDFNRHVQATYPRFQGSNAAQTRFALSVRYKDGNGNPVQNAFFTPQNVNAGGESFTGLIAMGTFGNREAARSSSVCQHEYCHALFSEIVQLSGSSQAGGLNEGLADYLPSAFKDDPLVGGWLVGNNNSIRDLTQRRVWPNDAPNGEVHRVGHIFAGALWRARTAAANRAPVERFQIDQAVVEGLFRLNDQPDLMDARDAILEGDRVVNQGANRVTLSDAFNEHGIGPAAQNDGPTLDALPAETVRVGETLEVQLSMRDPDGDPLRVGFSTLDNASYDAATETFRFTPDATQVGTEQVTFTASDEELSDSQTLEITIEAAPPTPAPTLGSGTTAAPATTANAPASAPRRGGGGGGGGCSLGAPGSAGGLWALALLAGLVALRRRS